jgi:hypothetical protein
MTFGRPASISNASLPTELPLDLELETLESQGCQGTTDGLQQGPSTVIVYIHSM